MKNWKITKTQIERIVIECPMSQSKEAIDYKFNNGYHSSGWSGPALNKKKSGPTYLMDIYHTEGEKQIPFGGKITKADKNKINISAGVGYVKERSE